MIKIAPSILSADFGILAEEIAKVEAAGADQLHIDIMDGRFVPNISMGFPILDAIRKRTRLPLDLHLMIVEPEKYLPEFAARGADMLTVHVEACPHLQRTLVSIRELAGKRGGPVKAGAALNPSTGLGELEWVTDDLDLVLLMSVNPGFGGQKLIPTVYPKIKQVRQLLGKRTVDVSIDGGVKVEHCKSLVEHGASILVAGSAVFEAKDPAGVVKQMKSAAG
ncbi:MAG TPA: ribulose-phosphate 3-epimerase [Methylomirabilota bacterium]|jgi:ribulose-phosphate 3-epimerase|nr:ribulose-phosphate 3-epimerase [Methylomirabilota bacterium]